ncbi:hypothetical protein SLEP1_g57359 [Rubroshorea leprosula]|uniref:Uncharacterized protein n=1 Tax=Rubroshorea leprosula TaxID=152421 RepID=A0AAV5MLG9_9ROSI|nr:hypothetical protein SLEP1_g57359 [Rubroshorea leprosula]
MCRLWLSRSSNAAPAFMARKVKRYGRASVSPQRSGQRRLIQKSPKIQIGQDSGRANVSPQRSGQIVTRFIWSLHEGQLVQGHKLALPIQPSQIVLQVDLFLFTIHPSPSRYPNLLARLHAWQLMKDLRRNQVSDRSGGEAAPSQLVIMTDRQHHPVASVSLVVVMDQARTNMVIDAFSSPAHSQPRELAPFRTTLNSAVIQVGHKLLKLCHCHYLGREPTDTPSPVRQPNAGGGLPKQYPINRIINDGKQTALHIAVLAGAVEIAEELIKRMSETDLEIQDRDGCPALYFAARSGKKIAECLVEKNPTLPTIPNKEGYIPVVWACACGDKNVTEYLYSKTPKESLSPDVGKNGPRLLNYTISGKMFDISLDLLRDYPSLAVTKDSSHSTPILTLSDEPSAFFSGSGLGFWQRLIYHRLKINKHSFSNDVRLPVTHQDQNEKKNIKMQGIYLQCNLSKTPF